MKLGPNLFFKPFSSITNVLKDTGSLKCKLRSIYLFCILEKYRVLRNLLTCILMGFSITVKKGLCISIILFSLLIKSEIVIRSVDENKNFLTIFLINNCSKVLTKIFKLKESFSNSGIISTKCLLIFFLRLKG